jgi:Carboxypeptidase regulatory-like domain
MRVWSGTLLVLASIVLIPSITYAQASIAGIVKDASGAVLPGVTVEASSPALIERTRSVVTDSTGQYKIVDLRPGTYSVTFALPGFSTVKRDGVELSGAFTATVNADLRVGTVEETITVSGETPIVDIQSTTRQQVLDHGVIDAVPTGRLIQNLGVLLPGVSVSGGLTLNGVGTQDVGGSSGNAVSQLASHGGRGLDQRTTMNGLSLMLSAGVNNTPYVPNMGSTQEVTIDTSGVSAEAAEGGVRVNVIPKEGGNTFRGLIFASFANESMQSSNFTDRLKARGFTTPNALKKVADINPAFGGPILQNKLWFYASHRLQIAQNWVGGMFFDTTYNDPNVFALNQDPNHRVSNDGMWNEGNVRLTWQATQRNKFGFSFAKEHMCTCPSAIRATTSPGFDNHWGWPHHLLTTEWTSPVTSRLLLEAGMFHQYHRWGWFPYAGTNPDVIGVLEQSSQINYKLRPAGFADRWQHDLRYRAAASYITGAHAFKVGFNNGDGDIDALLFLNGRQNLYYRFNNGVPNLITVYATPYHDGWNLDHDLGIYAQDRWTISRLTLTGGVRFDSFQSSFPEETYGPIQFAPARNFTLPRTPNSNWKDITPRMGVAYDVFGNGKTALKISLNKYLIGSDGPAFTYGTQAPYNRVVHSTTRTWSDGNRNFAPDCDLTSAVANGECGPLNDPNFGKANPSTTYDPKATTGWGNRPFDWEFATSVQHQALPRVSVDVGYFRRWYGNFGVIDNLALGAVDFDPYCITAPADSRLPAGGASQVCGLYNVTPSKFSVPAQNFVTLASTYGTQIEHWNGVDFSANARLTRGLTVQGGVSTGRTSTDNCDVVAKLPELISTATTALPLGYCSMNSPWLTQVKALGSYTIPRVDVQVGGSFQSNPGPIVQATFNAPTALAAQSLGRPLSGNAANAQVNLFASNALAATPTTASAGALYGDRVNQLDLRVGKLLKFGQRRTALNLDVYNALNSNAVLTESTAYGTFRVPQIVMVGRFVKISAQLDF